MSSRFEQYRIKNGDNLGDPDFLNTRLRDIDLRILAQEGIEKDWLEALTSIQVAGLARLDEVLLPVFNRISELAQLGALFTAHSQTEVEISAGLKRLTIDDAERDTFAPAAYVAAFVEADISKAMLGVVQSYDRASGELELLVDRVAGTGNGSGWIIHAASATDNAAAAAAALTYRNDADGFRLAAQEARATALAASDAAAASATSAAGSATAATTAKNTTVAAKDTVIASLAGLDLYYLKDHAVDPTASNTGGPLVPGMQYFNTTVGEMRVYKAGSGWIAEYLALGSEVGSVFGRSGAVGAVAGDYTASQITNVPAGNIAAVTVQAALAELDSEKVAVASIVNNVTAGGTGVPLSAEQGKTLKTLVDAKIAITAIVDDLTTGGVAVPLSAEQGKTLKALVDAKVAIAAIVNNLTAGGTTVPLSAEQGKTLKTLVDAKIAIAAIVNDLTTGGIAVPLSAEQGKTLKTLVDTKQATSEKGAANGYASLDGTGKVPESQLPAIAVTDAFPVASQAAMLALTAEKGDLAIRSDLNKTFCLSTSSPSTLADWLELRTPTDAVLSVAGKTGAVTLAKGDVGLGSVDNTSDTSKPVSTAQQTALNAKADLGSAQTFTKTQRVASQALTHNTAWDARNGNRITANVNGSTFTVANPTNLTAGDEFLLEVTYTTSHGLGFGANFTNVASQPRTATAGAMDIYSFYSDDGTNLRCVGYMLNVKAA